MKTTLHLSEDEVKAACVQYARTIGNRSSSESSECRFVISPAYHSGDPRENKMDATLDGADVTFESTRD